MSYRLSVRSRFDHRPVAEKLYGDTVAFQKARGVSLLLIHGFANTEDKAANSYKALQTGLDRVTAGARVGFVGDVFEFHWPGDYPEHKLMSAVTYPTRVPAAGHSGQRLADFLATCDRPSERQQIVVVAHSLGCRVALEALFEIAENADYEGPQIVGLALLAPAVSVYDCQPGRPLIAVPGHAAGVVFYSNRDGALKQRIFALGQRGVGERGKAVGRLGEPRHRWEARIGTGLRHKKYWASAIAAEGVATILGFGPTTLSDFGLSSEELDVVDVESFVGIGEYGLAEISPAGS